jgi:hypothetical protein
MQYQMHLTLQGALGKEDFEHITQSLMQAFCHCTDTVEYIFITSWPLHGTLYDVMVANGLLGQPFLWLIIQLQDIMHMSHDKLTAYQMYKQSHTNHQGTDKHMKTRQLQQRTPFAPQTQVCAAETLPVADIPQRSQQLPREVCP